MIVYIQTIPERYPSGDNLELGRFECLPVLEVKKLGIDLLDVHFSPQNIKVSINASHDIVIQAIQFLQQVELFLCLLYVWIVCDWQTKQLLTSRVGVELTPQVIKTSLEQSNNQYFQSILQNFKT